MNAPYSHAMANAARIGIEFGALMGGNCLIANIDEITAAAHVLAEFENAPGFDWETSGHNWEEVCAFIAGKLNGGRRTADYWRGVLGRRLSPQRKR